MKMKFAVLITALLSILAASPASSWRWKTGAAVNRNVRNANSELIQRYIERAAKLRQGAFTWRSSAIPLSQWLARWVKPLNAEDEYPLPSNIFVQGFTPKVDVMEAIELKDWTALNLKEYVRINSPSIFVGTTRYVRNDGYIWTPRNRKNAFRYDVFAPGGIVVNPTIGPHQYENQNEIAFIGGIHWSFIYGALEYTPETTQKCYHINPNYRGDPIARHAYPRISKKLPRVYYNRNGTVSHTKYPPRRPRLKKRSATISNGTIETVESRAYSESPGTFCYKVVIQSISIDQPNVVGLIKPYGKINVFIQKPSSATIWDVSYKRGIPKVMNKLPVSGREVYLKADISSNPRICFEGSVHNYNQGFTVTNTQISGSNKLISDFVPYSCEKTQSSLPSKKYVLTSSTKDGSVEIQFKVARCGN